MRADVRFHIEFLNRDDEPLRFSDVVAFVEAVAASAKVLDPSINKDHVIPLAVKKGSLGMEVAGPSVLSRLPGLLTKPRKKWDDQARRIAAPLVEAQRKLGASVSVGKRGGQLRPLVVPPSIAEDVESARIVDGSTQIFGYLERSGGEQPTAQVRLPNDALIHPRIRDIELSKRLAAHHYEDLFFTLAIRLDASTGKEVGVPMITDFRPYQHVALHDIVQRGDFDRVQSIHGSVDDLLRDRESMNRVR